MPPKIRPCFLLIWFGSWPDWIEYFFQSCGKNPDFEWLIFHDLPAPKVAPENVHLLRTNKEEIERRVSERLNIEFSLSYGYKICDLRPAYGHVFQEELAPYSHWGWTDLDQIWGDISRFLAPNRIEEHDILTAATHHLVGHCTLIRNTPSLNHLYETIPNFNQQLMSSEYEALEEKSFDHVAKAEAAAGRLRIFESRIAEEDCWIHWNGRKRFTILWEKGRLRDIHTGRALCYFHFIKSKYRPGFQAHTSNGALNAFFITPEGIRQVRGVEGQFQLFASAVLGFGATFPFYAKSLAKRILPKDIRSWIRNRFL